MVKWDVLTLAGKQESAVRCDPTRVAEFGGDVQFIPSVVVSRDSTRDSDSDRGLMLLDLREVVFFRLNRNMQAGSFGLERRHPTLNTNFLYQSCAVGTFSKILYDFPEANEILQQLKFMNRPRNSNTSTFRKQ